MQDHKQRKTSGLRWSYHCRAIPAEPLQTAPLGRLNGTRLANSFHMASCWPRGADITNTYHPESRLLHHLGPRHAQETSRIAEETWLTQSCDLFKGPVLEGTCIPTCVLFSLFKPHYCNESAPACSFPIVSFCPFYLLQSKLGRDRRTVCRASSWCQSSRSEWSHRVFPH